MSNKKEVDANDYTTVRENTITKSGVFLYSGKSIGIQGLEENKLYPVYRAQSELDNMVKRWQSNGDKPIPIIEEHTALNTNTKGSVPYEKKPALGVLFSLKSLASEIVGDIILYSKQLVDTIKGGKDELSLGYTCDYEAKEGVYKGQLFSFIQKNLLPNHLAVVQNGRMGHDVCLTLDSVEKILAFDSVEVDFSKSQQGENKNMDKDKDVEVFDEFIDVSLLKTKFPNDIAWIDEHKYQRRKKEGDDAVEVVPTKTSRTGFVTTNKENKKESSMEENKDKKGAEEVSDQKVDKRELIREIMAIAAKPADQFKGGDKEKEETISKKLEEISYEKSSEGGADDKGEKKEESKEENKDSKEDTEAKDAKACGADEEKDKESNKEDKSFTGDAAEIRKSVMQTIRAQENFAKKVFPVCGQFAYDEMETVEQMAQEACKRLKLNTFGNAMAAIEGFMSAASKNATFTFDSGESKKSSVEDRLKSIIK